jgi:predicted protein tyrosine phosphatase
MSKLDSEILRQQFVERATINHENYETYFLYLNSISLIPLQDFTGRLFLSGRNALNSVDLYEIQHLISVCNIPTKVSNIQHDIFEIDDKADEETKDKMKHLLDTISDSIHESLSNNKTVCVHCFAGQSRSVTIVIYYLAKYHFNRNLQQAIDHVVKYRPIICPNQSFIKLLVESFP